MPILAAFLKRPMFSLAGVTQGSLRLSLQASFLTYLLLLVPGTFAFAAAWSMGSARAIVIFGYMAGAILLGALIDNRWAAFRTAGRMKIWPFVLGNIISAAVIGLLPFYRIIFRVEQWGIGTANTGWLMHNVDWIAATTVACALLVYVVSFVGGRYTAEAIPERLHTGFEVLPAVQTQSPSTQLSGEMTSESAVAGDFEARRSS